MRSQVMKIYSSNDENCLQTLLVGLLFTLTLARESSLYYYRIFNIRITHIQNRGTRSKNKFRVRRKSLEENLSVSSPRPCVPSRVSDSCTFHLSYSPPRERAAGTAEIFIK
jgi:hypothetical protein